MTWQEVLLWFGPAFAWITIWTQFVTLRFFDKNETLFKDLVSSGARDMALSCIDTDQLIPVLAKLCECVATAREGKDAAGVFEIRTEELLLEVDFLPYLSGAESALREKKSIEEMLANLQHRAASLWKVSLLHSFAVVLLPTSFLFHLPALKFALLSVAGITAAGTFAWLLYGTVSYQRIRDSLLEKLALYRKAA
jgi:hypothetical protein